MSAPHFFQKSIFRSVGAFARDRAGNIAIMFAVSLLPLTIAVGAAIDYGNGLNVKAKLQGAIDAGLLKAATDPTLVVGGSPACATVTSCNIQIEQAVRDATRAYYATYQGMTPTVSVTFSGGDVSATASIAQPTGIMKIVGKSSMAISANAEVKRGTMGGAEVALVVDTTGSMASPKIDALKTAATQFVTALLPSGSTNKVALVPFDMYVRVGLTYRNASWLSGAADSSVPGPDYCYDSYPISTPGTPVWITATCTNDGVSSDCSYWYTPYTYSGVPTKVCSPTTVTQSWYGCVGSRTYPLDLSDAADSANPVPAAMNTDCAQPLTRLTTDATALQASINALSPYSETYIAPGLLWGWRALSPNPPFADGAAYGAKSKYIVLMTDGANTHSASYPGHANFDVVDANKVTGETCTAIKATGIRIYVVAFMVTDAGIISVLQNCASAPINYYTASTVTDLQSAFQTIGSQITKVRLTK